MRWIKAEPGDMYVIGENLREQDKNEVLFSHGLSPVEACLRSYRDSQVIQAIEGDEGDPVGITGLTQNYIWLLGTDKLTATKNHRWQLCIHGREWVEYCIDRAGGMIENYVYSENKESIRWLKHLGFNIGEPEPYGVAEKMFCHFWRKA